MEEVLVAAAVVVVERSEQPVQGSGEEELACAALR